MALDAIAAHGVLSPLGAAGVLALAVTVASTGFVLTGAARTLIRLAARLLRAGSRAGATTTH